MVQRRQGQALLLDMLRLHPTQESSRYAQCVFFCHLCKHYQNLFYLLQTEPKYLANLVYLMQPEQMESFLDTVILTLYGDAFSPREEYLILKLFQAIT